MSAGFSLVEALVGVVLTMLVTGAAMSMLVPASKVSSAQTEVMDVQQRARVAAEMIARDLASAGAGLSVGPWRGVLPRAIPAVLPRRMGAESGDGPDVARATALTMLSVPSAAPQTTTAAPIGGGTLALVVNAEPQCGTSVLCGLQAGQDVLVTDGAGHFDVFRITRVSGGTGTLRHHGQDLSWTYPAGAWVSQVVARTYEFSASTRQLRQYDGDQSDQPAVDYLSGVSFSYFGTALGSTAPVEMPLSSFTDGPWIGAGTTRFDADLLRVRGVRVSVGAEAADAVLRARVPVFSVSLDVAPRSLSVGR